MKFGGKTHMDNSKNQVYNEPMEFEKTIYNILKGFEKHLDNEDFDLDMLDYKVFNISEIRFTRYMQMLLTAGFIEGIKIIEMADKHFHIKAYSPAITLKGLEYLAENSMMQKVVGFLKKGAEITIPAMV